MAVKAKPGIFRHEQSLVCDLAAKYGVAQAASASAPDSSPGHSSTVECRVYETLQPDVESPA